MAGIQAKLLEHRRRSCGLMFPNDTTSWVEWKVGDRIARFPPEMNPKVYVVVEALGPHWLLGRSYIAKNGHTVTVESEPVLWNPSGWFRWEPVQEN